MTRCLVTPWNYDSFNIIKRKTNCWPNGQ